MYIPQYERRKMECRATIISRHCFNTLLGHLTDMPQYERKRIELKAAAIAEGAGVLDDNARKLIMCVRIGKEKVCNPLFVPCT